MKKNRRIIRLCVFYCLTILVASMLGTSCVDEDIPGIEMSGEGIHFGVSLADNSWKGNSRSLDPDSAIVIHKKISKHSVGLSLTIEDGISSPATDGVASRGLQYLDNTLNEFKVAAYYFNEGTVRDYFVNANGKNGLLVTDGVNTETTMYWPLNGTLDFLAISPKDVVDEMPLATTYTPENGIAFTYSLDPDAIKTHTDVMAAFAKNINKNDEPLPVNLNFKHLFAAVQFKLGKMLFIDINSITVTGVKGGTISFIRKKEGSGWEYAASKGNESYVISKGNAANQEGIDTYGMAEGVAITSNEQGTMLFVMPQELTREAKLIVNYDNHLTQETNVTEECPLMNENVPGSMAWEAGKIYAYTLNIGDEFNVTIPAPTNQDAHYVMVPMPYDLGDLITKYKSISNITASVSYINNTADQDVIPTLKLGSTNPAKTALADLEGLTDLQKQGYWTDKEFTEAEDGTRTGGGSVRGNEDGTLLLNNSKGTIVMFLPENTGKTDRDVVLTITGTATVGKESVELTIGKCQFKQLCPSWVAYNGGYIGSERIVEKIYTNDDGRYPYGFKWNRKVTYTNTTPLLNWLYSNAIASLIGNPDRNIRGTFKTLNDFVEYTVEGSSVISKIVLNYAAINNLRNIADDQADGYSNTYGLYNFTAGVNPSELEASLDGYVRNILWFPILKKTVDNNTTVSSEYAAFTAIKRNKFNEISRTFEDGQNDDVTTIVPELTEEGIQWYLPSINEGLKIKDNGDYALKADVVGYWSSTSYEDDNSNSQAYYFIYNPNGDNQSSIGDRTSPERRVRAVVQWTGQGSPLDTN